MADLNAALDRPADFFRSRWHGRVSLDRLFWVDMVLVATLINLATSFAALIALGFKWPTWASIAIYAAPLPYNVFLVLAVWRMSERLAPRIAGFARTGALGWLVVATVI